MITSIEHPLAQQIVDTVADACGKDVNYIRTDGVILASTRPERIGTFHEVGRQAARDGRTIAVGDDSTYRGTRAGINMPILYRGEIIAVVGISGPPEEVQPFAHLAERITHLLIRERELNQYSRTQADKCHYIIQTLLSGESFNQEYLRNCLADFHMDPDTEKRLVMIRVNTRYNVVNLSMLEPGIRALFSGISSVYTYNYPNEYLAMINDSDFPRFREKLEAYASRSRGILDVSAGTSCPLSGLSRSYQTAVTAWKSILHREENFCVFDDLTLEILLSSVSAADREEFRKRTVAGLSAEDCRLLETYFDSDMSLKTTCEQTFMHKNTVQYKLNRICRTAGLNPRKFRDAVLLYLGLRA